MNEHEETTTMTAATANPASGAERAATKATKRAYEKPSLIEYGDVREFTRGPGGSVQDVFGGDSYSKA